MDWNDEFKSSFSCKAIIWGLMPPHAMLLINTDDIPSLPEIGAFFTKEIPEVSSVRIVTQSDKFVHFFKPSRHENWRISKSSDN
ncbi:hypothetical protein [Mesorhizobium sp. M0488]|uniref:hypothetical protein n=1 Tax=unclassified Mesorhizobium TaxID=325217 RepID=UPI003335C264